MASFARTAGQYAAAAPDRSVWVSANAGTGKTRVLVDRIARLLLNGAAPEKILCLTFTKTGAAEMAERINTQLGHWSVMSDAELIEDIRLLNQREPDEATLKTARQLFARVLDVPGGLKIRTIHSFCESLIGRFPIEAGVAPHFSVVDERTTAELLSDARERLLAHTLKDPDGALTRSISALAELLNEDDFTAVMQDLAGNRAKLAGALKHHAQLGGVEAAVTAEVGLAEDETSAAVILRRADGELDADALLGAADVLEQGAKTSQTLAANLRVYVKDAERARRFATDYAPLFVTGAGEARKKLTTKGAEAAEEVLRTEQDRVLAVLEKLKARAAADATVHLLTVGRALLDGYAHLKSVHAYLDYDDLIDTARGLLVTQGGVSWVHFKLDGGIDHILVDESQDTSPAQWDVVRAIATEFFTGEGAHEAREAGLEETPKPRTVFAVGDEKQSIYSFQGADPHEFGRMREHFEARIRAAGAAFASVPLTTSFRTTKAVLAVVDRVFATPEASDGLTFAGEHVVHTSHRAGEAGLVEMWPTLKPQETEDSDPWDAPLDYVNEARPEMRLAQQIADTIKGWIDGGELLTSQNRPITAGDVLILVRRRARFAEEMVRQLKARAIPVAGADRMVLTEQMAVMDLLAAGRVAVLAEDDLSLAEVLKSPLVGLSEEDLFALAYGRAGPLWTELKRRRDETPAFQHAHDVIAKLLARADFMPPFEFYAELLRDGGRAALTARLGIDAEDPIDEFLGLALDFERTHTPSLQGFLHWVTASAQQIKRDMETQGGPDGGQVRVMTVHGAKGLEAGIVFLTDTCTKPDGRLTGRIQWKADGDVPTPLWAPHKDAQCQAFGERAEAEKIEREREYRRLLYVAMTRAKDRLYITGYEDSRGRAEGCWYNLIRPVLQDVGEEFTLGGESAWRYETRQEAELPPFVPKAAAPRTVERETWMFTPPPSEETPPRPLTPSRPEPEAPPALGPFEDAHTERFKRGLLVHKLLETLPTIDPGKRRSVAETWLAQPAHDLDAATQSEIADETLGVLDTPAFADLFGPDSLAEVSLSGVVEGQVVSARLDRLCVTETEVIVIDYKTNRPAPTDPNRVAEQYLRQMATYRTLLARIYPEKRIRAVLLWTDGPHVMELNDEVLRAYAPLPG